MGIPGTKALGNIIGKVAASPLRIADQCSNTCDLNRACASPIHAEVCLDRLVERRTPLPRYSSLRLATTAPSLSTPPRAVSKEH